MEVLLRENNKSTESVARALQAIGEDKGEKTWTFAEWKKEIEAEINFLSKPNSN